MMTANRANVSLPVDVKVESVHCDETSSVEMNNQPFGCAEGGGLAEQDH